jgi:hypothetical protein
VTASAESAPDIAYVVDHELPDSREVVAIEGGSVEVVLR